MPGPPPPPAPSQRHTLAAASSPVARDEFPPEEVPTRRYAEIGTLSFPPQSTVPAPAQDSTPLEPQPSEPSPVAQQLEARPVTLSDTGAERTFWDEPPRYSVTTVRPPEPEAPAPVVRSRGRHAISRVLFLSLLSLVLVLLGCEASAAWHALSTPTPSAQLG